MRLIALLLALATPAGAACVGQNLFDQLSPEAQAAARADAAAVPNPEGLYWEARRGSEVLHILGTLHVSDPRHEATLAHATPDLTASRRLFVEAGPDEKAQLQARLKSDASLSYDFVNPPLPEALGPDWPALATALEARGMPPLVAERFKPWMVLGVLSLSPCALQAQTAGEKELDDRVIAAATEAAVPVAALEPYDTLFRIFEAIPRETQLDMLRDSLADASAGDDGLATVSELYFAEELRLVWEFSRQLSLRSRPAEEVNPGLAQMEDAMMTRRNRAWAETLDSAAAEGPLFVAVGGLHLPGEEGLLNLLAQRGFTLTRLPLK